MSKFFARSDSESESESSEAEELPKTAVASKIYQVSDEEEETKRVVRSAKDKRFTDLQSCIKVMRNHKKIKDITNVLDDFESLTKLFDKSKKVVEREGCPRFYIRCISELEEFANLCWEDREERKKMSKHNAKSLTTLRQKIRKYNKDNFEEKVSAYRQSPDVGDDLESGAEEDEDEDEGDEDEDDFFKKKVVEPDQKAPVDFDEFDDDDDDDDDSWGDDLDSETSSDDEEGRIPGQLTADFFRKKVVSEEEEAAKRKKIEEKRARKMQEKSKKDETQEDGEWTHVGTPQPQVKEKPKMFPKETEITHEAVIKKMIDLTAGRGRKGTDRQEQIELLHELRAIASEKNLGDAIDTKLMFAILSAVYDYNPNIATSMKTELWEKCMEHVREILDRLINKGDEFVLGANILEDSENFSGPPPYRIRGCILMAVERMDEEYTKMLQACDAHSTEYVDRLRDEHTVCKIIEDLQKYLEDHATTDEICRVYMKRINHVYYKFDHTMKKENQAVESQNTMDKLCKYIYAKDNTDRIRTCAILSHIYHHALHDRWFEARDLMLMSHLQDTIQYSDIPTQILYNRAMVQLGLCAFRQGMIKDAHSCLVDIQSSGRAKELLAQGLSPQRQHERTPEQEKVEKRRQMPYHMHINLELLECVYLVSAMLIEIPYMAAHEFDARRRMISKNFHYVLRVSDRQTLVGPPESMREHVVAASKAMKKGDWKACKDYLINEKMNAKVWDLFYDTDRVRELIEKKVQEESLRTYLFAYSSVYDSISLATIAEMFELDQPVVMSIISKMIINQELMASIDEPTKTLGMHRTEPTRLQSLALQLSEKVASLVDYNERLLEMKQGNFFPFQRGQGRQDGNYNRDRGDRNEGGYGRSRDDNRRGGGYNRDRDQGGSGRGGYNRDRDQGNRRNDRRQNRY